jgi:bacterioferritin
LIQTVIDLLNEARLREFETINQYMIHHDELKHKDFATFASRVKDIAGIKMKHAEKLAERISFLKGEALSKVGATPKTGQDIPEMLATDIALEERTIMMYKEAAEICAHEKDQTSKALFEELLRDEENHLNFLETMKGYIDIPGRIL